MIKIFIDLRTLDKTREVVSPVLSAIFNNDDEDIEIEAIPHVELPQVTIYIKKGGDREDD